jgi:tetratricopeptide (TPR) repeat protein
MRALEKERGRRYESPGALAGDVTRYLRGEAVDAAPPSRFYRARKFVGRHRVAVVAAALVVAALVLGSVGTGVGLLRARAAESEARQQALLAGRNAETAKIEAQRADREAADAVRSAKVASSVNRLMQSMIQRADRGKEGGRADVTVREVMDAAARELESQGAPGDASADGAQDPTVSVALAHTISDTYRELSLYDKAVSMARIAADGERTLYGEESVGYAAAMNDLGSVLKLHGDIDGARVAYKRAHEIALKLGEPAAEVLENVEVQQGVLAADTGDDGAAEAAFRGVIARGEARGGLKTDAELEALNNIAAVLYGRGKLDEAEAAFQKSVELRKRLMGLRSTDLLSTIHNLGALQYAKHDYAASEKTLREEVATAERIYGSNHMEVAGALHGLGVALLAQSNYSAAESAFERSLAIMRLHLEPDHLRIGGALRELGSTQLELGEYDKAERSLKESCGILDPKMPAGDTDLVWGHYQLAWALMHRGAYTEAEAGLRPVVEAAGKSVKQGDRHEWILLAARTLLGELVARSPVSGDPPPAAAARAKRLSEAETLIIPSVERLLAIQGTMGPRMRGTVVPAAVARAVHLYELWTEQDPSAEHAKALSDWKARLAALGAPAPATDAKQK